MNETIRRQYQEGLYEFPYHYLPHWGSRGEPRIGRALQWGFDYLTWLSVVEQEVGRLTPQSILDVGCGDGRLLGLMDAEIPVRVGIDTSIRAIAFAKAFYPELEWIAGDVNLLKRCFDCATLVEVMEHIPDQEMPSFMDAVRDKILVGGHLIISVPTVWQPLNPKHFRHYTFDLLVRHLGENFEVQSVKYVCRVSRLAGGFNRFIYNNLYILNSSVLLLWMWKQYKKYFYWADEYNGRHMIVVARRIR